MTSPEIIPARLARQVLLKLQGLDAPRVKSSTQRVAELVERLGYVQIDSINVIDRAHHLILSARLDEFRPAHLAAAIERQRSLFEHWTHDACVIPTRWYPHWHHRFDRYAARDRSNAWWRERFGTDADQVMRRVLARVKREGPLRARDFMRDDGVRREPGGWWNWHPEKAALEHLWRSGRLSIAGRERFEKIYDLPERVHPELHAMKRPPTSEHLAWLCESAIERLGFATEREIAAFWSATTLAEVRAWVRRAEGRGALVRVMVESEAGGKPTACVALPEWRRRFAPLLTAIGMDRARSGAARRRHSTKGDAAEIIALAPFDPILRDRARALRLFGFDYRFEAFTPAAKRKFGYYTMPLLEGGRLIGRVDPRFDRAAGVLEIRGPWWEEGVTVDRARRARLDAALDRLAANVGAKEWRLLGTGT